MAGFTVEPVSRNVVTIRFADIKTGWRHRFLLSSDRHHDNPDSRWDLELKHLNEARELGASIYDVGDLNCAMQGKWDPRKSLDKLRPEHQTPAYMDALTRTAADFYEPYAENFALIGLGNHETAVIDRSGTDLTERLVSELRRRNSASQVVKGGYGGWVRFQFEWHGTKRASTNLKYYHGNGGDSPVTRGVIDTARQAAVQPDADIVVNGHNHNDYILPIPRERLSQRGDIYHDACWFIRTGTYKDEYRDGYGGWMVEKTKGGPKALGAVWGEFEFMADRIMMRFWADIVGNTARPIDSIIDARSAPTPPAAPAPQPPPVERVEASEMPLGGAKSSRTFFYMRNGG